MLQRELTEPNAGSGVDTKIKNGVNYANGYDTND